MNEMQSLCVAKASKVIRGYAKDTGLTEEEDATALRGLLADLMYWADTVPGLDFDYELRMARDHYRVECKDIEDLMKEESS